MVRLVIAKPEGLECLEELSRFVDCRTQVRVRMLGFGNPWCLVVAMFELLARAF